MCTLAAYDNKFEWPTSYTPCGYISAPFQSLYAGFQITDNTEGRKPCAHWFVKSLKNTPHRRVVIPVIPPLYLPFLTSPPMLLLTWDKLNRATMFPLQKEQHFTCNPSQSFLYSKKQHIHKILQHLCLHMGENHW